MKNTFIILLIFLSTHSYSGMKKSNSIVFDKPIMLGEDVVRSVQKEFHSKKYNQESFNLLVECHRYVSLAKDAKGKPLNLPFTCYSVGAKTDFGEEKKSKR